MALSMDEQRMLAEIERRLSAEDPGLATRLASFKRHAGPAAGLRTTKGRLIFLAGVIAFIAVVSVVICLLVPFRSHPLRTPARQATPATLVVSGGPSAG